MCRGRHDAAIARWEGMQRCRRYRTAVQQLQGELSALQAQNAAAAGDVDRARTRAKEAERERDAALKRMDDLQSYNEQERQVLPSAQECAIMPICA